MSANIQAFNPAMNDEFDDEPATPYPAWLWKEHFRNGDAVPTVPASRPAASSGAAVLAYLAVWLLASLSVSVCIATLTNLFG